MAARPAYVEADEAQCRLKSGARPVGGPRLWRRLSRGYAAERGAAPISLRDVISRSRSAWALVSIVPAPGRAVLNKIKRCRRVATVTAVLRRTTSSPRLAEALASGRRIKLSWNAAPMSCSWLRSTS